MQPRTDHESILFQDGKTCLVLAWLFTEKTVRATLIVSLCSADADTAQIRYIAYRLRRAVLPTVLGILVVLVVRMVLLPVPVLVLVLAAV